MAYMGVYCHLYASLHRGKIRPFSCPQSPPQNPHSITPLISSSFVLDKLSSGVFGFGSMRRAILKMATVGVHER